MSKIKNNTWLKELSNDKLIKRLKDADFNFNISCINGNPNYKEQEKSIMYENELLSRLEVVKNEN